MQEPIPRVRVLPNSSGIDVSAYRMHGAENLLHTIMINGALDVPPGVSAYLHRTRAIHAKGYYIPAPGILEVVSIQQPAKYNLQATIPKWKTLLAPSVIKDREARRLLYRSQLSEIPWMNAGRCFHAKLRQRSFPWGEAVLFLTTYVQGSTGAPVNNDMLVLVVQGFSNDGRYAINGRLEMHHPKLPDLSEPQARRKVIISLDHEMDRAEKWLDAQPDSSFEPSFQQCESFLQSLRIEAPVKQ